MSQQPSDDKKQPSRVTTLLDQFGADAEIGEVYTAVRKLADQLESELDARSLVEQPDPHEVTAWRGMRASTCRVLLVDAFQLGDALAAALIEAEASRGRAVILLEATQAAYVRDHKALSESCVQSSIVSSDVSKLIHEVLTEALTLEDCGGFPARAEEALDAWTKAAAALPARVPSAMAYTNKPPCGWSAWNVLVQDWFGEHRDIARLRGADLWDRVAKMLNTRPAHDDISNGGQR